MRKTITTIVLACALSSCSLFTSLTSTTYIKANESFVLGNNEHGAFNIKLKNNSNHTLKIIMAPIEGGTHSPVLVNPNETIYVKTEKNTAAIIENKSDDPASVAIHITGDTGLSMGYKN